MGSGSVELSGYMPGAIGRVTELHARYYSENWGFDLFFESKVATELSEFLWRFDSNRDGFWIAVLKGEIIGSVALDGVHSDTMGAHLRWFIVDPRFHDSGIGSRLLNEAIEFGKQVGFNIIYLWTFSGLDRARHVYEKFGFSLVEEIEGQQWGSLLNEQRFELRIS